MKRIIIILISLLPLFSMGQKKSLADFKPEYINWFNKDYANDNVLGASVDKAYEALKNLKPKKTVIVAVIDGGVDITHEDFAGKIWTNTKEIPNNNIDDDKNGYVDDIHGWNFIGNRNGENLIYESYEYTRILKNPNDPNYNKAKKLYEKNLKQKREEAQMLKQFEDVYYQAKFIIFQKTGITIENKKDLEKVNSKNEDVIAAKAFLMERYEMGMTEEDLKNFKTHSEENMNYLLNKDFNPRPQIIGDNPDDLNDRNYGNNDVKGERADHGTSVAGIIAAVRDNNIGINGIADNVKIMSLRVVPNGDENDKDIALAIMYAVDNGADIINMSFGKPLSPHKDFVDQAVRYAEKKGVLLIHAAGNEGTNIDKEESYPSDRYLDGNEITNWINVGASAKDKNEKTAAIFSNYGKKHVDLFAPGVDIISLDTANSYNIASGTSDACPVVSGISALILSYYPQIKPAEMIDILMQSVTLLPDLQVLIPNTEERENREKVPFESLSKSGGIINAYNAIMLAQKKCK